MSRDERHRVVKMLIKASFGLFQETDYQAWIDLLTAIDALPLGGGFLSEVVHATLSLESSQAVSSDTRPLLHAYNDK
jgi:hypothetical protein